MKLRRFSEPVPPSGGLQAQGVVNLLGAPPMDPLTLVLREAAQNIWDARRPGLTPTMRIRVRMLVGAEADALRDLLLTGASGSGEPAHLDHLSRSLRDGAEIPVLELCDFGTTGLSGHVNPVRDNGRFVRFFFDIGSPHFDGNTGGTYGFGRASLYLASAVRTIVVDSLVLEPAYERRVMACRLGESYTSESGPAEGNRHTGRHFWGVSQDARSVQPITGDSAAALAAGLGLPARDGPAQSGTTILIPWPQLDTGAAQRLIPAIVCHNLWPKLVPVEGQQPMHFEVETSAGLHRLGLEHAHPVYQCFATALTIARTRKPPAAGVGPKTRRDPAAHVALCLAPHVTVPAAEANAQDGPDPMEIFRDGLGHVALMRASELVVRYARVDVGAMSPPWAGVVLAQATQEVAAAFAAAEPPAHDDWNPAKLSGPAATLVRMTLRRFPEAVQQLLGIRPAAATAASDSTPLASAADLFASEFLAGDGSGAAPEIGRGKGGGTRPARALSVPEFIDLGLEAEQTVARYRVTYDGPAGRILRATSAVAIEGGRLTEAPGGMQLPEVIRWTAPDGSVASGGVCRTSGKGTYEFVVAYGGEYAVDIDVELEAPA